MDVVVLLGSSSRAEATYLRRVDELRVVDDNHVIDPAGAVYTRCHHDDDAKLAVQLVRGLKVHEAAQERVLHNAPRVAHLRNSSSTHVNLNMQGQCCSS